MQTKFDLWTKLFAFHFASKPEGQNDLIRR